MLKNAYFIFMCSGAVLKDLGSNLKKTFEDFTTEK